MPLKNLLIDTLEELADLSELNGDNPFKIKAFRNGSNIIRKIAGSLEEKIKDGSIKNEKGIGKGIYSVIEDVFNNGFSKELENLKNSQPPGLTELLSLHGLGIKKIKQLISELGINSLDDLDSACKEKRISLLKGFGIKTEDMILTEIERIRATKGFMLINTAEKKMASILEIINKLPQLIKSDITGEIKRKCEVVKCLEITALVRDYDGFYAELKKEFGADIKLVRHFSDGRLIDGLIGEDLLCYEFQDNESSSEVKIFCTREESQYRIIQCLLSGTEEFNHSVPDILNDETIPEMRESDTLAKAGSLRTSSDLDVKGLRGLLHFHTTYSDGINSIEEMVLEAHRLGFQYAAVCDHSKSAFYANGLKEEIILKQKEEIASVVEKTGFCIYQGIESDILTDGNLDYSGEILQQFEFIVASVHSRFNMSEEEMTSRIIKAVECEYTDVLGHPTGRLLLSREPYKVNIKKIIDACSQNKVAIEINASPYRLDLDWRNIWYAREAGCMLAINPDSHSAAGITDVRYGIGVARKAGVMKREVINYFDNEEFIKFLNRKIKKVKNK